MTQPRREKPLAARSICRGDGVNIGDQTTPPRRRPASARRGTARVLAPAGILAALLLASLAASLTAASAAPDPGNSLARYRALPPDSTDARQEAIADDAAGFRDAFDGAIVHADLADPGEADFYHAAAGDYLEVTGDSLLVADVAFVAGADPGARAAWTRALAEDARGLALRQEDLDASAAAFRTAAESYRALGHLRREAVAWGSMGVSLFVANELTQAKEAYRKALDARERLGDPLLIGRSLNALGSVHFQLGDYATALDYYRRARAVRETLDRPRDLGTTLGYLGNVYYRMGRLEEARESYEQAIRVFGPAGATMLHPARLGLANVYSDLGEYHRALDLYREHLALAQEQDNTQEAAKALLNIALTERALGDPTAALRSLGKVRELQVAEDDTYDLATTLNWTGIIYRELGNLPRSMDAFKEAGAYADSSENELDQALARANTGDVYLYMNLPDRALEAYRGAVAQFDTLGAVSSARSALAGMADAHQSRGEYETALQIYRDIYNRDQAVDSRGDMAGDLVNVGNALNNLGRLDEALHTFREATALAGELARKDLVWRSYLGTADCFERRGVLDSAQVYNGMAIDLLETFRGRALSEATRTAFLGQRAYVYEAQIHVLGKLWERTGSQEFARRALAVAERGKARALLESMGEGRVDLDAGVDSVLAARQHRVERALKEVQYRLRLVETGEIPADSARVFKARLRDLEKEQTDVLEQIRLNNPRFGTLDAGKPSDLETLRRDLLRDKHDVLLEYALGDSASYVWVVTRKDLTLAALPPRSEIEGAVQRLRSGLTSPRAAGDAAYLDGATALYRMLLEPVAGPLAKAKTVLIVPDGALQFVPFGALLRKAPDAPLPEDGPERNATFAALPYAFSGQVLCYGSSATTLATLARNRSTDSLKHARLLGLGAPAFAAAGDSAAETGLVRAGLAPLPFTRGEVEAIAQRFPPDRREILLGEEARESRITAPGFLDRFDILHFATHGLIDERYPERSSLALSHPRDASEDGYLQASEIYRLHTHAGLVVLSACETGLGKMVAGEGVLGLPRAFFYAGASEVLVSLWSVSDRSTASLMDGFYQNLITRGEPPARALAGAKGQLRRSHDFAHPFYWAPFVLMGPA